jgi:ribosomal protein L17
LHLPYHKFDVRIYDKCHTQFMKRNYLTQLCFDHKIAGGFVRNAEMTQCVCKLITFKVKIKHLNQKSGKPQKPGLVTLQISQLIECSE